MDFILPFNIPKAPQLISHQDKILSIGSCFTEHIGRALSELKFDVLQNPNGILFDPVSVAQSLISYIHNIQYAEDDLFYLNELWHSWRHHSRFSGTDQTTVLQNINQSQTGAHQFLKNASWLIITLGSSFSYQLINGTGQRKGLHLHSSLSYGGVANCHRAPAQWFQKHLLGIDETVAALENALQQLFLFNPKLHIIFTISPVRHIRDGVVDNNRSKARLIEAVHHLIGQHKQLHYFPSYEIIIDILRDYRFYDIDMVHPDYFATDFVLQQFIQTYMSDETQQLLQEIKKIIIAGKHRSAHPNTEAHKKFLNSHFEKVKFLQQQYPHLNFEDEVNYFSTIV